MFENREFMSNAQAEVPPGAYGNTSVRYYNGLPRQRPQDIPWWVESVVDETPFYKEDLFRAAPDSYAAKVGKSVHRY